MLRNIGCTNLHSDGNKNSHLGNNTMMMMRKEHHTYLITVPEETETKGLAVLNDMIQTRREIHLKQGSDMKEIFGYYNTILSKDNVGEKQSK